MFTGLTTNFPTDALLNAGAFMYSLAGVATKIGVTEGAPDFDPGIEQADLEFDGKRVSYKGQTRRVGFKPILKGVIKELGPAASGKQIPLIEPGSSEAAADGSGTKLVTLKPAGALYASADYITNLRWICERASGGYAAIFFPIALCTKWSMKGVDKKEAQISVEFLAIGDPAADPGLAPYAVEIRTALPTT